MFVVCWCIICWQKIKNWWILKHSPPAHNLPQPAAYNVKAVNPQIINQKGKSAYLRFNSN